MPLRVLNEDWSDYDNKKKKKEDSFFFSCEEAWEVEYLTRKIRRYKPSTEAEIKTAILSCCGIIPAPRPREKFVTCVMSKL